LNAVKRAGVSPSDVRVFPELEYRDEYGRPVDRNDDRQIVASTYEPELGIGMVRGIISWSRTAPQASEFKVAILRLDNVRTDGTEWSASSRTLAAMLKLLEEPPPTTRFILLATHPTMPMIKSRSQELIAGLLEPEQVAEILFCVSDLSESEAKRASALGGGRVAPSLALVTRGTEGSVQAVVDVLTSLAAGDQIALTEKARIWTEQDTEMLVRWAHEKLTGDWLIFAGSGAPEVSSFAAQRVLRAVSAVRGARPRLVLGAVAALVGK
jgi:DNA polymerase III delta prime subunit